MNKSTTRKNNIKQHYLYQNLRHIYRQGKQAVNLVTILSTTNKPKAISWRDFLVIELAYNRYQPLLFPDGEVIPRTAPQILDSRDKLEALNLPKDLTGKTALDVGCAEGFFVVQAALRNAERAIGCDLLKSRLRIASIVAKSWGVEDRVLFSPTKLYDIRPEWASDIVLCLSMAHHLHGGFHDTWRMICQPNKYADYFDNMMQAVTAVSSLTKEVTYWEYAFEYLDEKPSDVDHAMLGQLWVQRGLYERVDFVGLSENSPMKDRALYRAYK